MVPAIGDTKFALDKPPTALSDYIKCCVILAGKDLHGISEDGALEKFFGRPGQEPYLAPEWSQEDGEVQQAIEEFKQGLRDDRTAFCTKGGYIGIAPGEVISGDICILLGCPTPIITRKEPEGRFLIVGLCYIYGLMKGEMMDKMENGKYKLTTL